MSELDVARWDVLDVPWAPSDAASKQVAVNNAPEFPKHFYAPPRPEGAEGYASEFTSQARIGHLGKSTVSEKILVSAAGGVIGSGLGLVGGVAVGSLALAISFSAGATDLGSWLFAGCAGIGILGGGVGLSVDCWRSSALSMRNYPHIQRRELEQLTDWLTQQGVPASEVTLGELVASVHREHGDVRFVDEAGVEREFTLDSQKKAWFITDPNAERAEIQATQPAITAAPAAPRLEVQLQLPGEVGEVHAEVVSLLSQLSGFALEIEQAHALSRARRELAQALALHAQLTRLNRAEAGQSELRALLTDLRAELEALVEEVARQKVNQLQVARVSVQARAVANSSSSRLTLAARETDREAAALRKVNA